MRQLQQQQKEFRELRLLRIDVKSLGYFILLNAIENVKSSEEREAMLKCWVKASGVPLGQGKGKGKGEGKEQTSKGKEQTSKAEGSKAQSTTP